LVTGVTFVVAIGKPKKSTGIIIELIDLGKLATGNKKPQLSLRNPRDVMLPAVACTVCEIFAFEI